MASNPSRQNKGAEECSSVPLLLLHSPHELKGKERRGKKIPLDPAREEWSRKLGELHKQKKKRREREQRERKGRAEK